MALLTRNSPGFSPWVSLNTRQERTDYSNQGVWPVPHAYIPNQILPSRLWQAQSYAIHCMLPVPWASIGGDAFSSFMRSGGSTSIMGASAGLATIALGMNEPRDISFGIGRKFKAGIEIGHCVGDKYWEKLYVASIVTRTSGMGVDILNHTTFQDVFQRSKLNRIYVNHGIVLGYKIENDKHILRLDINGSLPEERDESFKVTIKGFDGDIDLNVTKILTNFDMVIETPSEPIKLKVGSFYILDTVLCLQDPYMLAGFYFGTEDEGGKRKFNSRLNIHGTSNNNFYYEVDFVGTYVLKDVEVDGDGEVVDSSGEFSDSNNFKWHWIKNDREIESDIYKKEVDRYGEYSDFVTESIDGVDAEINVSRKVKREVGTQSDVDKLIEMEANSIRMEINSGGSSGKNNWHAPILSKNWFKQDGNYFKILNQPDGNVIDISLKDVTGEHDLDLTSGGSIFNHYGWFIVEHYMGEGQNGLFGGGSSVRVVSSNEIESTIKIEDTWMTRGTLYENISPQYSSTEMGINSFYNRFKKDTAQNGGTKKLWKKYDGWKLVTQSGKSFNIKSIDFPSEIGEDPLSDEIKRFEVTIVVEGDASSLDDAPWVCFDTPYTRLSSSVKTGILFVDYQQGVDEFRSATLCADITYASLPMKIDIPKNTIVGVCGGRWMGLGLYGSYYVTSNDGLPLIVRTSAGSKAISCSYDDILQTNWVLYSDVYTDKLTIRYGQLDFRESPQKIEVSFGGSKHVADVNGFPIILDTSYDRTRLITMDMPATEGGYANTFEIGNSKDNYGFLIGGNGIVDFQALRRLGYAPGELPVETYKFKDYYSSPVYLYHKNDVSFTKNKTLFIGQSTSEGQIHSIGESPTNVKIHYIDNWQTIENAVFDIHQVCDGETIIVYSVITQPFTMNGVKYNDFINNPDNAWNPIKSVYMLSTVDDGASWNAPTSKNLKDYNIYKKPLMIMNSVDYIHSVYDNSSRTFHILSTHADENGRPYLGVFNLSLFKLLYRTELCTTETDYSFLWRPPLLDVEWTPRRNKMGELDPVEESLNYKDSFVKIMGSSGSNIIDENVMTWTNITGSVTENGVIRLLYEDSKNIKVIFSTSSGLTWSKSEIIVARNSNSALCIDDNLFYISSDGIAVKYLNAIAWQKVYQSLAGSSMSFIEEVQTEFDSAKSILLSTGQIDEQRLSGYRTNQDVYYIFYYDNNGTLSAFRGDGRNDWSAAANF